MSGPLAEVQGDPGSALHSMTPQEDIARMAPALAPFPGEPLLGLSVGVREWGMRGGGVIGDT